MNVQLCKKSVERVAGGVPVAIAALREREHTPLVRDCLNRCQRCEAGGLVAVVDGLPLHSATLEALLDDLDALGAEEL